MDPTMELRGLVNDLMRSLDGLARSLATVTAERDEAMSLQAVRISDLEAERKKLRALVANASTWLEANTDKSARRFYAKRLRMEAGL